MNIALKLQELLDTRGVSRSRLAREIGVHTSTVSNWIDGKEVKSENLAALCAYFGCSLDYLAGTTTLQAEKAPTPIKKDERRVENPDIRMIARAGRKMTPEQAENLRKYAQYMFPEAFEDDDT